MTQLLAYSAERCTLDLHLMLSVGFFTGARLGTVNTLTVTGLYAARESPLLPGAFLPGRPVGAPSSASFPGGGAISQRMSVRLLAQLVLLL